MTTKTILITGCSAHGIGAGLAISLARRGHHIFATARSVDKVSSSLTALENVTVVPLDVTDLASVQAVVETVQSHGRGLDVLVNNAGIAYTAPLLDSDIDHSRQVYEANVWGPLRLVQAFADLLIEKQGRVVNISSIAAVVNIPWIGVYSSSKAALVQLSETLRLELGPLGVQVTCVMAGTITTALHANEPEVVLPSSSRYTAIGRTISNWTTGRAGPQGISVDQFAESIVYTIVGPNTASGLVWRGPMSSIVRMASCWCPAWLLDYLISNGRGLDDVAKSMRKD